MRTRIFFLSCWHVGVFLQASAGTTPSDFQAGLTGGASGGSKLPPRRTWPASLLSLLDIKVVSASEVVNETDTAYSPGCRFWNAIECDHKRDERQKRERKEKKQQARKDQKHGSEEDEKDDEDDPIINLTVKQDVWLQAGWLIMLSGTMLVGVLCFRRLTATENEKAPTDYPEEHGSGWGFELYKLLYAKNRAGSIFNTALFALTLWNFIIFAVNTERRKPDWLAESAWIFARQKIVIVAHGTELLSWVFFCLMHVARLCVVSYNPKWNHRPRYRVKYFLAPIMVVDFVSLLPFALQPVLGIDIPNLIWMRLVRWLDTIVHAVSGARGFSAFSNVICQNKELISTAAFLGFSVWVLLSALVYAVENSNDEMTWGRDTGYNRFKSIPSSMYFTLISLNGEFPNADARSTPWGRIVAVIICFFGVAVFGAMSGVMGALLSEFVSENHMTAVRDAARFAEEVDRSIAVQPPRISRLRRIIDHPMMLYVTYVLVTLSIGLYVSSTTYTPVVARTPENMLIPDTFQLTGNLPLLRRVRVLDGLLGLIFFVEFLIRCRATPMYFRTLMFPFDLIAWLPGVSMLLLLVLGFEQPEQTAQHFRWIGVFPVLHGLTVTRVLKLDRFIHAFSGLGEILMENRPIVIITGALASFVWLFASVFMFYAERYNPDDAMREHFSSVPRSMWMSMLDLTSEAPVCDHMSQGKFVHSVIMLVGISLFTVPIGIFGAAFQARVEQELLEEEMKNAENQHPRSLLGTRKSLLHSRESLAPETEQDTSLFGSAMLKKLPEGTRRYEMFKLLMGSRHPRPTIFARFLEMFLVSLVVVTCVSAVVESLQYFDQDCSLNEENLDLIIMKLKPTECHLFLLQMKVFNMFCAFVFAVEYTARVFAHPCRCKFMCSFHGVVDVLCLFPVLFYVLERESLGGIKPETLIDFFIVVRLLRFLTLEHFFPSLTILWRVACHRWKGLVSAFYVAICLWLTFGTILHVMVRDDGNFDEGMTYAERYASYLTALQYTLVHISGDYPLTNYRTWERFVHAAMLVCGNAFVAVPAAILSSGFSEFYSKVVTDKRQEAAARKVQARWREYKAMRTAYTNAVRQRQLERSGTSKLSVRAQDPMTVVGAFFFYESARGKVFGNFTLIMIWINLFVMCVRSLPQAKSDPLRLRMLEFFDNTSLVVFLVSYIARLYSAPAHPRYRARGAQDRMAIVYARYQYLISFSGIADLLAMLPNVVNAATVFSGVWWIPTKVTVALRSLRVLLLEQFLKSGHAFEQTWLETKNVLGAMAFIALLTWVTTASLWFFAEGTGMKICEQACENTDNSEWMTSIGAALYYSAIFLQDEWAFADFGVFGKVLCIFYVFIGVAIFAMPIGTFIESLSRQMKEKRLVQLGILESNGQSTLGLKKLQKGAAIIAVMRANAKLLRDLETEKQLLQGQRPTDTRSSPTVQTESRKSIIELTSL